jgi:hypothetical protein
VTAYPRGGGAGVGDMVGSGRGVARVRGGIRGSGGIGGEIVGRGVGVGVGLGEGVGVGLGDSIGDGDGVGVAGGIGSCASRSAPLAANATTDSAIFILPPVRRPPWRQEARCKLRARPRWLTAGRPHGYKP